MSSQQPEQPSPLMQQIGMLNLRVSDMMTQCNSVLKMLMDENGALKRENAELKSKLAKMGKQ